MARKRSKKKHGAENVELNMAAMLDMAFQLLTFFILTFRPAEVEGEVALRLPQAAVSPEPANSLLGSKEKSDASVGLDALAIGLAADGPGNIAAVRFGDDTIPLAALDGRLKAALGDPQSSFQKVVIQASPRLRYDALMGVVDKCTRQKLASGAPLKNLSFVEGQFD
jgi:biopolymer transport protein ExbD